MFKQIMTATVLGVSALGMMAANATSNGIYVDGQIGYARTGNPKGLPTDITIDKTQKTSKGEMVGRLAIGYQFSPNWAVELGYLQLGKQKSNLLISTTTTEYMPSPFIGVPTGPIPFDVTTVTKQAITINQRAFDIVGKGIYPISDKFNVYAKAGMAYLTTTVKDNNATHQVKNDDGDYQNKPVSSLFSKHNWAPEVGIGLTYDITPNMFIDTSITHIQPIGKNKPSNIDFATVGIGYSFG
jgi:OmpA-OmpF porin, OOP family